MLATPEGISHDCSVTTEDESGREFFLTPKPPRPQRAFAFFASLRFIFGGDGRGVVLPVKKHHRLLEDLHDLAVVAERRVEKPISSRIDDDGKDCR